MVDEEDFLADLENDFELSGEEENEEDEDIQEVDKAVSNVDDDQDIKDNEESNINIDSSTNDGANAADQALVTRMKELVNNERNLSTEDMIQRLDMKSIKSIKTITKLLSLLDPVLQRIDTLEKNQVDFTNNHYSTTDAHYDFLVTSNEFVSEIGNEISLIHSFIKSQYSPQFSELETIVVDPVEYCQTLLIIGNDLGNAPSKSSELKKIITGEKILVINMSILELKISNLPQMIMNSIIDACNIVIKLDAARIKITKFISEKLSTYAPNLSRIIGSYCAVQLMSYCGGLDKLAYTPSCNIPSIGTKKPVKIGFGQVGIRQKGFLYSSSIISEVPENFQRQAMRIVSGKLLLAARMDLAGSNSDGSFGIKTLEEIQKKLEKLMAPPDNVGPKALPIPIDKTSKKRGGRRFRKMKEKYQMTDLQKAQNRMVFGKEEDTVMTEFGDEIGLGMAGRNSMLGTGNIRAVGNTKIKHSLSKKMNNRLKGADSDVLTIGSLGHHYGSKHLTNVDDLVNSLKRKADEPVGNEKKRLHN
ncbi:U4/U6-U5 snRNP complex subunit [Saccharomycopsis crataegensis]|uniref:U4/U6-U5 snRNP complex subunit n=1 Tax=Saccharomycopsis crataegensis TaxID=43959 RepID=A0AAV5QFA8_9ASCO|nr:U4/U6-U5 snRNP complex subunit [Saccharomycopsis crataegensis]